MVSVRLPRVVGARCDGGANIDLFEGHEVA